MKSDFDDFCFGFIGLGLIGGSIAKAIKKEYKNSKIIAFNRSEKPRLLALEEGVIDIGTDKIDEVFNECDFIFLCTPVEHNEHYLSSLKNIINDNCIITDVGSVKGNIHASVIKHGMEANFIGGHPMAGSEKTGYENSNAAICNNAFYPITKTEKTTLENLSLYEKLLKSIGFKPIIMDYNEHDYSVAAISHLPHLIAAGLVNMVEEKDSTNKYMHTLAAGGFRDTTRIASSSPEVWEQICITNSRNISDLLGDYIERLTNLKSSLDNKDGDYIHSLFDKSKKYRDSF
jgi:prephenate dehydrogenase